MHVLHGNDVVFIWSGFSREHDQYATVVTFGDGTIVTSLAETGDIYSRYLYGDPNLCKPLYWR